MSKGIGWIYRSRAFFRPLSESPALSFLANVAILQATHKYSAKIPRLASVLLYSWVMLLTLSLTEITLAERETCHWQEDINGGLLW